MFVFKAGSLESARDLSSIDLKEVRVLYQDKSACQINSFYFIMEILPHKSLILNSLVIIAGYCY